MAPVRAGMVAGFEPISYLGRLRKVLDALHTSRQNLRESEMLPPFFPDVVGRFRIIHNFRYALVPPATPEGTWQLSLNVTYDGGFEPYMRVIYRDIGTLLDLLFCHSPEYPGSRTSSFDEYCAWVRRNEIAGGIFYDDSAMTLDDHQYLAQVEKAQREGPAADADFARICIPSDVKRDQAAMLKASKDPLNALVLPLRTLKGLFRLSAYFPAGDTPDGGELGVLRRFARNVLKEPMAVMGGLDHAPLPPDLRGTWLKYKGMYADELGWLKYDQPDDDRKPEPAAADPSKVQSHIFSSGERMTHGCSVLLRIDDKDKALANFPTLASLCGAVPASGIGYLIAFTYAGLKKLGIAQERLNAMPQEFIDGMEARAALLGDVRGNHPDRWTRPLRYEQEASGQRVDMKAVHVFVLLRLADETDTTSGLHPRLQGAVKALEEGTGLKVLSVQPTRSYRSKPSEPVANHFGFADGLSQPEVQLAGQPAAKPVANNDVVSAGELLLGHRNDRGDEPGKGFDPLLMDGSFLVVRKLRQRVDNFDKAMEKLTPEQRAVVPDKMMGRKRNGDPLVQLPAGSTGPNDYNYEQPAASDGCPFHSHVRRANPRDGRAYTPRILRRGMSYGPMSATERSTDRGIVFMAYCARIAEQFEAIQRWVAGGNSSGVGSAQADPFLRVPQVGEKTTFRYLDEQGGVVRVQFDDQPLVQLQWGVYLFVPSLAALRSLDSFREAPAKVAAPPARCPFNHDEAERERVRSVLEDPDRNQEAWKHVREGKAPELQDTAYGHLLGRYQDVLHAMKDKGGKYSVAGYGERMGQSIGLNLLGLDPGVEREQQKPLNDAILEYDEVTAFNETLPIVQDVLAHLPKLPPANAEDAVRIPIDLVSFSDQVMARLCSQWIGLPEDPAKVPNPVMDIGGRLEDNPGKPRCPGNFATASRYIFSPHPREAVQQAGQEQGQAVLKAVQAWLARPDRQLGTLARKIQAGLKVVGNDNNEALAHGLAGVLLGFPPTVQGNFIKSMDTWIGEESLWDGQQMLYEASPGTTVDYPQARTALRDFVFNAMRRNPVPSMLWRSPVHNGVVDKDERHRVVLGIASALAEKDAPRELVFGRDRDGASPTVHGCPGYAMGMGVLLAMTAGLMKAGTLRPTGSPVLLILTPNKPA
ncbi:Dyp-type peroxidase [Ramlibacter sp. XY19]|uniref:Dyp-type peroxidase n=1 Tax=Ramlibacter paludis TaxID=2908000 RepID=UPI0023D988AB|nr:Dyp-type peroxidase domain-containing protein [Ramlibacter paludis]MCG2592198.1 Dyp-type peroxidase [Ramlibacter paludis]